MGKITEVEVGRERQWNYEGKVILTKEGHICLSCIYMQCSCGSPRWGKLGQKLPKPTRKFALKEKLLETLNYKKLFYLRDVRNMGQIIASCQHNYLQAEMILELLGYDYPQRDDIMAGWVAEFEQANKAVA